MAVRKWNIPTFYRISVCFFILQQFEEHKIAEWLWNCDETGFCTAMASKKVLAKQGAKIMHEGGGSGREYITVLGESVCSSNTIIY